MKLRYALGIFSCFPRWDPVAEGLDPRADEYTDIEKIPEPSEEELQERTLSKYEKAVEEIV